jgi:hypothetical protein
VRWGARHGRTVLWLAAATREPKGRRGVGHYVEGECRAERLWHERCVVFCVHAAHIGRSGGDVSLIDGWRSCEIGWKGFVCFEHGRELVMCAHEGEGKRNRHKKKKRSSWSETHVWSKRELGTCLEYACANLAIIQFDDTQDGLAKSLHSPRYHEGQHGAILIHIYGTFLGTHVSTLTVTATCKATTRR